MKALSPEQFEYVLGAVLQAQDEWVRAALLVDLFWSALRFPASAENDRRQNRLSGVCRRAGFKPEMLMDVCRLNQKLEEKR